MSFDAALKRVFDAAVQELTALASEEQNRAREQGTDEGRAQGVQEGRTHGMQEGHAQGLKEGLEQGLEQGLDQGRTEGHKEGHEQGHALGVQEGRGQGREEAAKESQVAMDAALATLRAESAVNLSANTRLLDAIRAIDTSRTLGEVLDTLTTSAAAEGGRAGVLLVQDGRLRGWRFRGFGSSMSEPSSVDLAIGDAQSLSEGRESIETPLALFGETVAVLYADRSSDQSAAAQSSHWRGTLEILSRHAMRALEALTAIKTARSIAGPQPAMHDHAMLEDADDAESSARRYAKLLVSEIKLYHESDVVAGRRDRDLASRLGGEISRARVLYEQRVPAAVRNRADYFRDELIRTLANGDATLLQLT